MVDSAPKTYKTLISNRDEKPGEIKEIPTETLGSNEVLIKVEYAPINPSDIGTLFGWYPVFPGKAALPTGKPSKVGLEGSGIIAAVGSDLKRSHKVGDKVSFLSLGTWGEYCVAQSDYVINRGDLDAQLGACLFVNPLTVLYMYEKVVKGGHKAVIHNAGASALGRMLIRYMKEKGIKTINLVRRDSYIQELKDLGADYVINTSESDFLEKLKTTAAEIGATICFDAVAGEQTGQILDAMPEKSELLMYGLLSGKQPSGINFGLVLAQKELKGLWLTPWIGGKTPEERQVL